MKIAYFSEVFLPKIDGVVNTLLRLFEYLDNNRHQSLLFTPHSNTRHIRSTPVITTPSVPLVVYPNVYVSLPQTRTFLHHLETFQPDLVHLINPVHFDIPGLKAARLLDIPVVASYQTDFPGYARTLGFGFLENAVWKFFRDIHNQADLNFAPSNITRDQMVQHGIERVKVWRRGIDLAHFSPARWNSTMRSRLTEGETEKPLLLYVGRLSPEKRVDWLLQLFQQGLPVRLAFVGDGPYRPILEMQFADTATIFTGFLNGEELYQAYASADMFVFPSKNETLGNVVLEAMASGLPVIAPTEGGQIDHVVHGETGLLFDADDPEAMVAAVKYLLERPELRAHMGIQAQKHLGEISWQNIFDQLLLDYEQTINNHPFAKRLPQSKHKARQKPIRLPDSGHWHL
jgi:glycosyltransferase involved in cell wall biosynthesis